ncbi:ParB-like protein [Paraburkholderia phymatum]|uniref:ParB-like protein n=1 Tax=Paraburkholderia phymatum TaxID=148447 RepID=A0ACC6U9S7_9BURK
MGKLHEVEVRRLHPTQITVGMIEVREKRDELSRLREPHLHDFLRAHPVPAVEGPNDKLYITDHHHLGRALSEEGIATGFFLVEADFSTLALDQFWTEMDRHQWVHPYDENGQRCPFDEIPKHVEHLRDDPFRSLAGYVRNAGGYQKTPEAFAEFLWADFFRKRISIGSGKEGFETAVRMGITLARSVDARGLPGYIGPMAAPEPQGL